MCRIRNSCPRCSGHSLVPIPGGWQCLACGREEVEDSLSVYAVLMSSLPGAPLPTRVERYEEEVSRVRAEQYEAAMQLADDIALGERAAAQHGMTLEGLQKNTQGWQRVRPKTRIAFHNVVADLAFLGWGVSRIGRVLHRRHTTIAQSSGLARGRARRRAG